MSDCVLMLNVFKKKKKSFFCIFVSMLTPKQADTLRKHTVGSNLVSRFLSRLECISMMSDVTSRKSLLVCV